MHKYEFASSALKQIEKLPQGIQRRIIKKLDYYCRQKKPLVYADFLIASHLGDYRFRIGDYRIVFDMEGELIVVLAVGHRREIYKER